MTILINICQHTPPDKPRLWAWSVVSSDIILHVHDKYTIFEVVIISRGGNYVLLRSF